MKKLRDDAREASLSPDGSQIIFKDTVKKGLWIMSADGQQARQFYKADKGSFLFKPTFFANGKRIAYIKVHRDSGRVVTLESRDLKGEDPVELVSNPRLTDFCWGGAGRLIYAVGEHPPNQYDSNLWQISFDPESGRSKGTPRRLTDWTGFSFSDPELTADGKRMVFLNDHSQSDVYIGELANDAAELKPLSRLTLDDRVDWPSGWSPDSKSVLLYSDRSRNFDVYRQGVDARSADTLVADAQEKRSAQISPDGKWIVYMEWPKLADGTSPSGKLMRAPVSGGPSEAIFDVKGHPGAQDSPYVQETVGGFPSFRCPTRAAAACVLAEGDEGRLVFSTFDPVQGRKTELAKLESNPDLSAWDLSPDGTRVAVSLFDPAAADVQVLTVATKAVQKVSLAPWAQLAAVAWTADGKALLVASGSSRGSTIVRGQLDGHVKELRKTTFDIFALAPSPDGRYLAVGMIITNANAWTIPSFPAK